MKKQTGQKEIMKKVLDYIRPQWLLVMLSLLMAVVSVALTLYLPVLTGNVVDHILGPGKVEFPQFLKSCARWRQQSWSQQRRSGS